VVYSTVNYFILLSFAASTVTCLLFPPCSFRILLSLSYTRGNRFLRRSQEKEEEEKEEEENDFFESRFSSTRKLFSPSFELKCLPREGQKTSVGHALGIRIPLLALCDCGRFPLYPLSLPLFLSLPECRIRSEVRSRYRCGRGRRHFRWRFIDPKGGDLTAEGGGRRGCGSGAFGSVEQGEEDQGKKGTI